MKLMAYRENDNGNKDLRDIIALLRITEAKSWAQLQSAVDPYFDLGNLGNDAILKTRLAIALAFPGQTEFEPLAKRLRAQTRKRVGMKTRNQFDQQAWSVLAFRTPFSGKPKGFECSGCPANFVELAEAEEAYGNFEHAWSEFLHEFYRHKAADFFAFEPPVQFSVGRRALLAGVAEALSIRFGLPVPAWVQKPEYMLREPWDPSAELHPGMSIEERMSYASPVFRKHNVVFKERSLIVL